MTWDDNEISGDVKLGQFYRRGGAYSLASVVLGSNASTLTRIKRACSFVHSVNAYRVCPVAEAGETPWGGLMTTEIVFPSLRALGEAQTPVIKGTGW